MRILPMAIAAAAAALLAGCASYDDLKSSAPVRTVTINGEPGAIADCYIDKRMSGFIENYQKLNLGDTLQIVVRDAPLWGAPNLMYQLTLHEIDQHSTRIELRDAIKPLVDIGHADDDIIDTVTSCAAKA
jgi:hypothetical protein